MRWRQPVSFLPNAILEPKRPVRAVLTAWLLAFLPSIALAAVAGWAFPGSEPPKFEAQGPLTLFMLVVFAPVVETLIMGTVLLVLLRLAGPTPAVLLSAVGWGLAHSALAPIWGLVIWWPFLIFSTLFVTWRQRSLTMAFTMPAFAHALQNLAPALMIAFAPERI